MQASAQPLDRIRVQTVKVEFPLIGIIDEQSLDTQVVIFLPHPVGRRDGRRGVRRPSRRTSPEGRNVQIVQTALAIGVLVAVDQLETRLQLTANLLFHRM